MLEKYWKEQSTLIKASGFIAGLGALFLSIPVPQLEEARTALANIQVFWLILLTACLAKIFYSFTKSLIKYEKEMKVKYDLPIVGLYSFTLGAIFLWVILNLWSYIFSLYNKESAKFLTMVFPGVVLVLCTLPMIFVEKNRSKFTRFSYIIIISAVVSTIVSALGIYFEQVAIGYFHLLWISIVLPALFIVLILGLVTLSLIKKKSLWEVLPLEISVHN